MKNFHGSVLCLAVAAAFLSAPSDKTHTQLLQYSRQRETVRMQEPDDSFQEIWLRYQKINPDLKAVLVFESGLLSLPVVQTTDNQTYLQKAFDGSFSTKGTPFLDCHDSFENDAFLIYGHHVFYDPSSMFSPLLQLETQSGYEKNRVFALVTPQQVNAYEIVAVFRMQVTPSQFDQRRSSFESPQDFEEWYAYVQEHNEIVPSERAVYGEKLCLLQTCVREDENQRLIVIARQEYR